MPNDQDRDHRKVRPTPTRTTQTLKVGTPVETRRGPGKVANIICRVGDWEGKSRFMPPLCVVELEEPWEGESRVAIPIQHIRLPGHGAAFKQPCRALWPDQVPPKPAHDLRPTQPPKIGLAALVKLTRRSS